MDRRASDRREIPTYTTSEAAQYLRVQPTTLWTWIAGNDAIVPVPEYRGRRLLSFFDLVECHVLSGLRSVHGAAPQSVRSALKAVRAKLGSERPLLEQQFCTDGIPLFVERIGATFSASNEDQLALRMALETAYRRVDRGSDGLPIRLRPFVLAAKDGDLALEQYALGIELLALGASNRE